MRHLHPPPFLSAERSWGRDHGCSTSRVPHTSAHTSSCQNLTFLFHVLISMVFPPHQNFYVVVAQKFIGRLFVCCCCLLSLSHLETGLIYHRWPQTCCVAKNDLEFLIPRSPVLTCRVYSPILPHLATRISISTCFLRQKEI